MSTQIKTRRGTAAEHTTFTGAEGELTVNTTNDSVHVHDGSTAGGHELARADGSNLAMESNLTFGDNNKAVFGARSDLQIYHDGSHSYIKDNGSGNLLIRTNGVKAAIQDASGNNMLQARSGGAVELHYDSGTYADPKLATTSTGIDVTGTATMDGLTLNSGGFDYINSGSFLFTNVPVGYSTTIQADNKNVAKFNSGGDISFYEDTGTTAKFFWDASAESLGIGTSSPDTKVHIEKSSLAGTSYDSNDLLTLENNGYSAVNVIGSTTTASSILFSDTTRAVGGIQYYHSDDSLRFRATSTERMRIDSSGNVGIGTTSPSSFGAELAVVQDAGTPRIAIVDSVGTNRGGYIESNVSTSLFNIGTTSGVRSIAFSPDNTERMRIDTLGNLIVGKTSTAIENAGASLLSTGRLIATADNDSVAVLRRNTSDGDIAEFRKDGTTVGSIGSINGSLYVSSPYGSDSGLRFSGAVVHPCTTSGDPRDNAIDLGYSSGRFKDLYLSGGVYLGGTGSANHLDDYESGTWTASVIGSTSGSVALSSANYRKVGDLVFVQAQGYNKDLSSLVGNISISGLPFTPYGETPCTVMIRTTNSSSYQSGWLNATSTIGIFDDGDFSSRLTDTEIVQTGNHVYLSAVYPVA